MRAWAGRLLSSPGAPLFCLVPTLLLGGVLALWLQPQPHSDWGYYWNAAGRFADYERGGIGLWLLAIPKALGFSPAVAALCLNLPAAACALWMSWHADDRGRRGLWLATAAYLFLLAPYFGIVQLDLVAATLLGAGVWLATAAATRRAGRTGAGFAVLLVVAAVSTRPQFALTLWTLLILAVPLVLLRKTTGAAVPVLVGLLAVGSVLGFGLDYALRGLADRSGSIRTSSAVTLYAGLLASTDEPGVCGRWSMDATRAAQADRHKPVVQAIADRILAQPASHWGAVLRCKIPAILAPEPYAIAWLGASPNVRAAMDSSPRSDVIQTGYFRAMRAERALYIPLSFLILAMAVATTVRLATRRTAVALLPLAWVASFWLVHLVFEIQGRYFLGMYLLTPLLCMLALSLAARRPGDTPAQAPLPRELRVDRIDQPG